MAAPIPRRGLRPLVLLALLLALIVVGSATLTRAQTPSDPASKLMQSLTPEQRKAISAALAAYNDELASLARELGDGKFRIFIPLVQQDAAGAVVSGDVAALQAAVANPDGASAGATLDRLSADVQSLQSAVEADLAAILTPEQMALYSQALAAATPASSEAAAGGAEARIAVTGAFNAVGCFNAAQWTDYAFAFNRAAKAFAIMAAFNADFGTETPEAIQAYISFNEAEAHAESALKDLSTAAVLITADDTLVQNINGGTLYGVKGEADLKVAKDRIGLATSLALTDYEASGGVVVGNVGVGGNYFAYFAYAYGDLADFFAGEALTRTINCY